jgi:hypothetical protein
MLLHVPPEAQGVSQKNEVPAVGGQIFIHIDDHEIAEADLLAVAAGRQDLVLAHGPDGQDENDLFAPGGFRGKILLEQIVGKPGDEGVIAGQNLDGDRGFFSDAIFGNFERVHV